MRVVFFGTVDLGEGYPRSRALLQALAALGCHVDILTEPLGGGHLNRAVKGLGGKLRTGLSLLRARRRLVERAAEIPRPDLVVVGYPVHGAVDLARRLWPGTTLVVDFFLSVYDTVVGDRKMVPTGSLRAKLLRRWDQRVAASVDLVLLDTEEMCDYLAALTGQKRERFLALPCGDPDALALDPAPSCPPLGAGPLKTLFVGTGIPLHGLQDILAAVQLTRGVELTLVGGGQEARSWIAAKGGESIRYYPDWVSRDELGRLLRASHLALGIFGTTPKADRVLPLKVYNALAEGVPVLTGDTRAARTLLIPDREVILAPRGDVTALAARWTFLARQPEYLATVAAGGAKAFRERFSTLPLAWTLGQAFEKLGLPVPELKRRPVVTTPVPELVGSNH